MNRDQTIAILTAHLDELRQQHGVRHLWLFGSVARDQATPASDVDLIVEFSRPTGLFGLFRLQDRLAELLGCSVDVGTVGSLKPRIRDQVRQECVDVAWSLADRARGFARAGCAAAGPAAGVMAETEGPGVGRGYLPDTDTTGQFGVGEVSPTY